MNSQTLLRSKQSPSSSSRVKARFAAVVMGCGLFLGIAMLGSDAKASVTQCTISAVWYDQYSGGRLIVFCNGDLSMSGGFIANLNETLCPASTNKSLDTIKTWTNMTTAFQLANRKIVIDFNDPSGTCNIKTINNVRSG